MVRLPLEQILLNTKIKDCMFDPSFILYFDIGRPGAILHIES